MSADLMDAVCDHCRVALTVNDDGAFFGDLHLFCTAQHHAVSIFQFQTQVGGDHFTAGEDGDVAEHFFSAVAEARSFDSNAGEGAAEFVQQQGGESFAFHVFCDDHQFFTALQQFFQQREDFLDGGDFFVGDEDESIVDDCFHLIGVGYHVWGQVAAVELHAFYYFGVGFCGFGFFDGDNAVAGYFIHCVSDEFADESIVSGNGSYSFDVSGAADLFGVCHNSFHSGSNSAVDTFFQNHWVCACGYVFHTFANQSLSQQGCGGGAVTGSIVGFYSNFFYQLSAHVFKWVFQLDFFCDGHAVVGDERCAEFFIQNHVAAFWTEGDFYGVSQFVDTGLQRFTGFFAVSNNFGHG